MAPRRVRDKNVETKPSKPNRRAALGKNFGRVILTTTIVYTSGGI